MRKIWHIAITIAVGFATLGTVFANERLEDARAAVSQWVEVEKTISQETLAWKEKKELLENMISVAKAEISMMQKQLEEAKATTNSAEARRAELVKERDENTQLVTSIKTFLGPFEAQLKMLELRLPKPLREKLEPLFERLPENPDDTNAGAAARMQAVIGILVEIQRFDKTVTTGEELVPLPGGETREIYTIHFGLGASYYVTSTGTEGGVGISSGKTWQWKTVPDLASPVQQAIDLAKGKSMEAAFLSLPVSTQKTDR